MVDLVKFAAGVPLDIIINTLVDDKGEAIVDENGEAILTVG